MKYFLYIAILITSIHPTIASEICPFELIKKSAYSSIREEFESVLGDLTKFDFILIHPESPLISVVIKDKNGLTRKYWHTGMPKTKILTQKFNEEKSMAFTKAISSMFSSDKEDVDNYLDKRILILYRKDKDGLTWRNVRFLPEISNNDFEIIKEIMIPVEEHVDPKALEDFIRGID